MNPTSFIKEIKSPSRRPLYVLTGGEPVAVSKCLEAAEEAVDPGFRDFNYQVMHLEAGQAGRLVSEALTGAFFIPPRVVVTKNPPFVAEDWSALSAYLEDPADNVVVLVLDKIDARLKFFKTIKAQKLEVDCQIPKGAALSRWLADEFKNKGVNASPSVCSLIIERAGADLYTLLGEAEKLSLYLGDQGLLTPELVRSLVSLSPEGDVFKLGEALGARNPRQALADLLELLATENHMMILAMMVRHFRLMLQIKTRQSILGTNRLGPAEAPRLGMHPFVLQKTQGQAAEWSWAELVAALASLEQAHRTLITTPIPPQAVLESLALNLTLPRS